MPVDPKRYVAPRLSKKAIWKEVEGFRGKYKLNTIPIDIINFIDFELNIDIVPIPSLFSKLDIDAFLYGTWVRLAVDREIYSNPKKENRLRFSIAHELGHYVLHRELLESCHSTPEEWIKYMTGISEEQYNWIEYHANEFAGRLLVPVDHLKTHFSSAIDRINQIRNSTQKDFTLESVSREIGRKFGVSEQVIIKRLKSERLFGIV